MSSLTGLKKADGQRGSLRRAAMLGGTTVMVNITFRHPGRLMQAVMGATSPLLAPPSDVPWRELAAGGRPARLYGEGERLVVYFHGGGFVSGDPAAFHRFTQFVAQEARCKVLSVDYRLAPAHPFPAAHDDAVASFAWAVEHADELGVDPDHIVVGGDSAGGQLAAAVALSGGPRPRGAWLLCPVTDGDVNRHESAWLFERGPLLSRRAMIDALNHYARGPRELLDERLTVVDRDDLDRMPPAYVATAGMDPIRDQGELLASRLDEVEHKRFRNLPHGFYAMLVDPGSRAAATECCAALDRLLG